MTTKMLCAIAAAAALLSTGLAATAAHADHETLIAKCSEGSLTAYVVGYDGWPALYVYSNGRQVAADWADEQLLEDSETVTLVGYSTGSIFNGGANLRLRVRDDRIPANEGSAHLTMRINGRLTNKLLACSVY